MMVKKIACKIAGIVFLTAAIAGAGGDGAWARNLPLVTVTVDVETITDQTRSISIHDQYDLEKEGVQFGTVEILNILEKNGAKGVFFYNVYEYWTDGQPVRDIAERIDRRGHDVELHTHPQWAYDKDKLFMHDYAYEAQAKIIQSGKQLLESWTGTKIIAHRAGAYGADFNTLKALEYNKIYLDSSYFFKHPWCKLNSPQSPLKKNYFSRYGNITEIPVNVFYLDDVPGLMPQLPPIRHVVKYDINEYVEENIFLEAVDQATALDYDAIVLFLHSYSLIDHQKHGLWPALGNIKKFEQIMAFLHKAGYQFVTFKDLEVLRSEHKLQYGQKDQMPVITRKINTAKYTLKKMAVTKAMLIPISVAALLVVSMPIFIIIARKRLSGSRRPTDA